MLSERGIVTEISNDRVRIICRSRMDCQRCAEGRGCGGGILARWLGDRQFHITAFFNKDAHTPQIGEQVEIGLPAKRLVSLALVMYGIPIVGMLLGLVFQVLIIPNASDLFSVLSSIIGLICGIALSKYLVARANTNGHLIPSVLNSNLEQETEAFVCVSKLKNSN